jgi:hypothetical protein
VRSDADIQAAANLWCSDRTKALKKYGHISEWNTSKVTTMARLFWKKNNFINDDISKWDVSQVADMENMFALSCYHGDLSNWDVSKVKNMTCMFAMNFGFNGDISRWKVNHLTNTLGMFSSAMAFEGNISRYSVKKDLYVWYVQNVSYPSDSHKPRSVPSN